MHVCFVGESDIRTNLLKSYIGAFVIICNRVLLYAKDQIKHLLANHLTESILKNR